MLGLVLSLFLAPLPVQPDPIPNQDFSFQNMHITRWSRGNIDALMVECPDPNNMHWQYTERTINGVNYFNYEVMCW
jgi:hypothetical protein